MKVGVGHCQKTISRQAETISAEWTKWPAVILPGLSFATAGRIGLAGFPVGESLHARPRGIEDRRVPGQGEGDLIEEAANRSTAGTWVERASRPGGPGGIDRGPRSHAGAHAQDADP